MKAVGLYYKISYQQKHTLPLGNKFSVNFSPTIFHGSTTSHHGCILSIDHAYNPANYFSFSTTYYIRRCQRMLKWNRSKEHNQLTSKHSLKIDTVKPV